MIIISFEEATLNYMRGPVLTNRIFTDGASKPSLVGMVR
jgi:hypothetical protein